MVFVFEVCFYAGLLLILISFVLGEFLDFFGVDGLDFDGFDLNLILPLSPMLLILLMTVFGGTGLTLHRSQLKLPSVVIVLLSLATGYVVAMLINRFVVIPLKRAENTSAVPQEELIGQSGVVTEKIHKNRFGEIKYVINGSTYLAPAKATTEEEILVGEEVTICWIEDHVFYVKHINID